MLRLLALLGGLSVALDLGSGSPLEESLRRCVVATRLARVSGLPDDDVRTVLYTALLEHLGCTAHSHELAVAFGDDVAAIRASFLTHPGRPADVLSTFVPMVAEAAGRSRVRTLAAVIRSGREIDRVAPVATCEVARQSAARLGLSAEVQEALGHMTAMWDGSGHPDVSGETIPASTRLMHVAAVATLFTLHADPDRALQEVRSRAGTHLDPGLAALVTEDLLADVAELDAYEEVQALEPDPVRRVDAADVPEVARAFGDLADLKSPWLRGHSSAVGDLAAAAGRLLPLPGAEVANLRVAGYLHDVGRIGVASRIWDKAGPLTATERSQVELHPWHTEQVLRRLPALAAVAEIAVQHHERLDGSGYHRHCVAAQIGQPSRVLAAADRHRTLVEDRPYRPAFDADRARAALESDVRAGRLDGDAVAAVLEAVGHPRRARRPGTAGLTERQAEVLRLLATGSSNRQIAEALVISRRTAEHHVQDVYARIGVSTRAGAALFAMEHGLVARDG